MSPVRPLQWFYVYILKSSKDGNFYTGVTDNIDRRIGEHNKGLEASTKYRRPFELVYYEACLSKDDAYCRERYLKTGMGKRYIRNRLKKGLTG